MLQPKTKYSIYRQLVPKNANCRDAINRVSTVGWSVLLIRKKIISQSRPR